MSGVEFCPLFKYHLVDVQTSGKISEGKGIWLTSKRAENFRWRGGGGGGELEKSGKISARGCFEFEAGCCLISCLSMSMLSLLHGCKQFKIP